jgi:hypothetical protein
MVERTAPYIGADGFDWAGLFAEADKMSGAYDLWEAKGVVGVWEIARRLDRRNFERVIDALAMCRGDLAV